MNRVKLAVAGAGLIGLEHIKRIEASSHTELVAIVDPSERAVTIAEECGVRYFQTLNALIEARCAEGIILATPNRLHAEQTQACISAGLATLIEKPVSHNLESARDLLTFYESTDQTVPVLVGHHRAYSSVMAAASDLVHTGRLGKLIAVQGSALFYKPEHYFREGPWRSEAGGGPILLNLIHEIGNLRHLCGEIIEVYAKASNAQRGFIVEDTCVVSITFANGALGSFILSDTAASPKSWEQTTAENPSYAHYPAESCYHLAGTQGSLSIPDMLLRHYPQNVDPSWWNPFDEAFITYKPNDPLISQIESFAAVIRGKAQPKVSLVDGFNNLLVVEAISASAKENRPIRINLDLRNFS